MYHNKYCLYSYFPSTVHIVVYKDDNNSFKKKVKKIKIVTFQTETSKFRITAWEKNLLPWGNIPWGVAMKLPN